MGRRKHIESPEELEKLYFQKYLKHLQDNPYKKKHWVGKDGKEVTENIISFPSWMGFESYLSLINKIERLQDYEENKENRYSEYASVISRIKKHCAGEMVTGALVGAAQHNLVARICGIKDGVDNNITINKEIPLFPDVNYDQETEDATFEEMINDDEPEDE